MLVKAGLLSAAISLPSFLVAPTAAFDWLANLPHYDEFASADWPQSITGIRHVIWTVTGLDLGSMASLVVAVTEDATGKASAVDLVKIGSAALGGKGGGGRPDMAQAGGPDGAAAQAALSAIEGALAGAN